jgi:hypothetical protein
VLQEVDVDVDIDVVLYVFQATLDHHVPVSNPLRCLYPHMDTHITINNNVSVEIKKIATMEIFNTGNCQIRVVEKQTTDAELTAQCLCGLASSTCASSLEFPNYAIRQPTLPSKSTKREQ